MTEKIFFHFYPWAGNIERQRGQEGLLCLHAIELVAALSPRHTISQFEQTRLTNYVNDVKTTQIRCSIKVRCHISMKFYQTV